LEVGGLLYRIKQKAEHAEWGTFLDECDLARSTADDDVRRYVYKAKITAPRQFNQPEPDPEAEQRHEQIQKEKKKREGKKPTEHATELHVRVKDLKPDLRSTRRANVQFVTFRPCIKLPGRPEPCAARKRTLAARGRKVRPGFRRRYGRANQSKTQNLRFSEAILCIKLRCERPDGAEVNFMSFD